MHCVAAKSRNRCSRSVESTPDCLYALKINLLSLKSESREATAGPGEQADLLVFVSVCISKRLKNVTTFVPVSKDSVLV